MTYERKIEKIVRAFPTQNEEGFLDNEIDELLLKFPEINKGEIQKILGYHSCMIDKNGNFITYHQDIIKAIECCLNDRDIEFYEWD